MSDRIEIKVGDIAPDFCLPDKDGKEVCLKDFKGKNVILYFYPKDNTPGCTTEAIGFTTILKDFQELDAVVIGVSPDSPASHAKFIEKKDLKVILLSDEDKEILKAYGAFRGKGAIRSTFLIDVSVKIAHIWPKVRVRGHPDDVKNTLSELLAKN
ncbi:MAG: peroxiredoxin [Promethearchaeota archaeon]